MAEYQGKKAKHEGIKKYDKFILGVCNVEHFSLLTSEEKNGYYGVAMLRAYQDGAKPNLKEFAYRLRVSPFLLEDGFNNLRANGIFNPLYLRPEVAENGLDISRDKSSTSWMKSENRDLFDWCWIAGLGSGLCGLT